jgi:cytochrome b6-f complex iron-sulfur subunit
MNRREVIQKFLVGSTVLVLVPSVLKSCTKDTTMNPANNNGNNPPAGSNIILDLSLVENSILNRSGSSKIVQGILIINTGSKIVALSSICTHQGCTVGYNATAGDIECPCHGSVFSTSGSVINGPALSPLNSYPVSISGTVLTITL